MAQTVRLATMEPGEGEVTVENVMAARWMEAGPMVHDGVRCVGCSTSPIVGRRFECDQCYDYNLCQDCCPDKNKRREVEEQKINNSCNSLNLPPSPSTANHRPLDRSYSLHPTSSQVSHKTISSNISRHSSPSTCVPLQTFPSTDTPQKQEHQKDHKFSDVTDKDTNWSRALRLRKDGVFRTIIGDDEIKKYMALQWVMNKEKSTHKIASYLLDMKGKNDQVHFVTNSVIITQDNTTVLIKALRNCWGDVALNLIKRDVDLGVKEEEKKEKDSEEGKRVTPLMLACKTNQPRVV